MFWLRSKNIISLIAHMWRGLGVKRVYFPIGEGGVGSGYKRLGSEFVFTAPLEAGPQLRVRQTEEAGIELWTPGTKY